MLTKAERKGFNLRARPSQARAWFWAGLCFLALALACLEIRQPYYFCQDDNFSFALPLHLLGCGAFFHGRFPTYNPYQFMGAPVNTIGCTMFLYPFLYVAYGIAAYGLHNPNATEDVFVVGHIVAGYAAIWRLSGAIGLRPSLSALAALTISLSGFTLIGGRSWDNTAPLMVFLPLTFLQLVRLARRSPDRWWLLQSSAVLALFMNAGFIQLWLYAMIFAALWVMAAVAVRQMPASRALWLIPVLLIAAAFFMPQALCFQQAAGGWVRQVGEGPRVVPSNLLNLLLPAPLAPPIANGPGAFPWGSRYFSDMGELYYSGTVLTLFGLTSLVMGLAMLPFGGAGEGTVDGTGRRRRLEQNVWGLLAMVALVFSLGSQALLWPLLHRLPLVDKMESPFKFIPFFNLFIVLQGALALERWLTAGAARSAKIVIATACAGLLVWHVALALPSFYSYRDRPYPAIPRVEAAFRSDGSSGRVLAIAPFRSMAPGFTCSLANDWPTVYHVYAFGGYDTAVDAFPPVITAFRNVAMRPADALRAYGVGWIVVHRTVTDPRYSDNLAIRGLESPDERLRPAYMAECYGHRPAASTRDVTLFQVAGVDPLAFSGATAKTSLRFTTNATGIDVDLTSLRGGGLVIVNFLAYKALVAEIDGRSVPIGADRWGRIVVRAPEGARRLAIRYPMPWRASWEYGAALVAIGLGVWRLVSLASRFAVR